MSCLEARVLEVDAAFRDGAPCLQAIRDHLSAGGILSPEATQRVLEQAWAVASREPNVIPVRNDESEVVVVGDIHGQFSDLLQIMDTEGLPCREKTVVFLGDYIDRGRFGTEVVLYLCACKALFPKNVVMIRGNHESFRICADFTSECVAKYGEMLFRYFMAYFYVLPLACVIRNTPSGDCFCSHGGLGPHVESIEEINKISRFCDVPLCGPMAELLWADPLPEKNDIPDMSSEQWESVTFVRNTDRQGSCYFGRKAVESFLLKNGLAFMIRGHQTQFEGYKWHFATPANPRPLLVTVFSAPNYCGNMGNRGAFLRISKTTGLKIFQFHSNAPPASA